MDALTTYRLFAADKTLGIERLTERNDVSRELEYYKENIGSVKSAEDLVKDQRLFTFVMRAYNLEDMSFARALMQKVMEGGTEDEQSLANRLSDPRYAELAEDFNFPRYGELTNTFAAVKTGVIDRFLQQTLEIEAGGNNDGARLAMYFERKASEIETPYSILADPAILKYVQTAYSLPSEMSFFDIDKQAEIIEDRLDIEDLKDPEFVNELTTQFLALWDISNPSSISVPPLVSGTSGFQGISIDLLSTLQGAKFRF